MYNGQIYAAEPTYCSTIGGIAEMFAHVVFGLPPESWAELLDNSVLPCKETFESEA